MRQPSLFDFKPSEKLRRTGLTPDEERQLRIFALSDGYPRTHIVERTGTRYIIKGPLAANGLLKALGYARIDRRTFTDNRNAK